MEIYNSKFFQKIVYDYIENTGWFYILSQMHTYLKLQSKINAWKELLFISEKVLNK